MTELIQCPDCTSQKKNANDDVRGIYSSYSENDPRKHIRDKDFSLWVLNDEGYCYYCDSFFNISNPNKPIHNGGYKLMFEESFMTEREILFAKSMFTDKKRFNYSRRYGFTSNSLYLSNEPPTHIKYGLEYKV